MTDPAFSSTPSDQNSGSPFSMPPTQPGNSYVNDYAPPAVDSSSTYDDAQLPTQPDSQAAASDSDSGSDEVLEAQNIFDLLGVMDGSDDEKESFLDELQQVIWEDFLENDASLLITQTEYQELKQMMDADGKDELEKQEQMVVFLEKLIPDLEDIMLEKALELKEDMVRERIAGMREYYAGQSAVLSELEQAESLINQGKWKSAAKALNTIQ